MNFLETLFIASIPALLTGVGSFLLAKTQSKSEIKRLKISNEHEIEKLVKQHKVDIESIREQHKLEMDAKDIEHKYKLEILQKEHENEMIRKEKELEDGIKYSAAGNAANALINGIIGTAFSSSEVKDVIGESLVKTLKNPQKGDSGK